MLPVREDRMWIRNAWYVAAWTHEIERGRIHARTIIDQPLVLYRTTDNGIVALEDRCPHRFAPLSLGRLEGDALRCMYHGLKFAPDGKNLVADINRQKLADAPHFAKDDWSELSNTAWSQKVYSYYGQPTAFPNGDLQPTGRTSPNTKVYPQR